jgi:hypothetical protein
VRLGRIYTSTDSGVTWTSRDSNRFWTKITSSADGTKLAAVPTSGFVYVSSDSGVTWTARESSRVWRSVASSADGTKLVAVANNGQVYISSDSGLTWVSRESVRVWVSAASSADGTKLFATVDNTVYRYVESPRTLSVDVLTPSPDSAYNNPAFVVSWGSATSCFYSYDGFVSTSTADCSSLGSDVARPPSFGTSTLSIRGIDSLGAIAERSVTFAWLPYYWCGTADTDWVNASNWYSDAGCSVAAGLVPGSGQGAVIVGSVSPIVASTTTSLPSSIDAAGLTGPANAVGIVFGPGAYNTARIIGNATFESASAGVFELDGSMVWGGTVSGTARGGDGEAIASLVFGGSSSNQTTISSTTSVSFLESSTNLGTVQGDASFGNTSAFSLGTVLGTAVLNGINQTIQGVNSVWSLVKQALSRDTLYVSSSGSLNVAGSLVLRGLNASNLLSIQSTVPGSAATMSIPGSANVDFVRLRDVLNSGTTLNLSGATAYDDGGNSGFSFPANSTPGSRSGLTSRAVRPSNPVTRAAAAAAQARASAPVRTAAGTTLALREFRKATALSLSTVSLPVRPIGRLPELAPLPVFGGTGENSFSFENPVSKFLLETLPAPLAESLSSSPRLSVYLSSLGVTNAQALARLSVRPAAISGGAASGTYAVSRGGKAVQTTLSSDGRASVFQELRIGAGEAFEVSVPSEGESSSATFDGRAVSLGVGGLLRLSAPAAAGTYILRSDASPLALVVRVEAPAATPRDAGTSQTPAPRSFWQRILGLLGR